MAGPAGFEPAHARIKTWCLTAWRRPNIHLLKAVTQYWSEIPKSGAVVIDLILWQQS